MSDTRALILTMTTYGTWLRGDRRGWIDQGIVMPPDPKIEKADRGGMKHPPFLFDRDQMLNVGETMGRALVERLEQVVLAVAVQRWHVHVVVDGACHPVGDIVKCAKDAVRYGLRPGRPIWGTGHDKRSVTYLPA
ncbi:MAG: hypothetical protein IID37_06895 [Planctomycetes bacterium]|nr:hypothetical protein [Planctomycetota bacterium]